MDSFAWVGTATGRRIVGSAVSSLFVIVVAVVFWEMVSSVIERYLARSEDGEVELSARAKTLLPLLRRRCSWWFRRLSDLSFCLK